MQKCDLLYLNLKEYCELCYAFWHIIRKSGQGFLIAPGQVTTYRADEQEPWEYTWIEFDGLRAHEALNLAGISGQNPVYSPASTKAGQLLQEQIRLSFFRHIKTPHLSDRILSDKWGVVHSGARPVFLL